MGRGLLRWSLKPNISNVARLLAFVTGLVNQELLLKNEYLLAENRILKAHLPPSLRLSRPERTALAEISKRLGRKLLQQVASVANPDTILGWYRQLVAAKFDGSRQRGLPGRPRIAAEIEHLVVRLARENSGWGYDRIVGALANLGPTVSDQTVGNILRRQGIAPARERKHTPTWSQFIRSHMAVLAGTDFFTVEVLTWRGLVTYYVLFFLHLETRRVTIAGITDQPDESWYHGERNHQGKGNVLLFPCGEVPTRKRGPSIRCHERLGGLLKYYHRKAA
jgi:putative transposase